MSKAKKKAAPTKKASTALAVRKPAKVAKPAEVVITGLPVVQQAGVGQLGELATVGALGMAVLKLTDKEEAVLSKPVDPKLIQLKPVRKGEPPTIPYLPHIVYTRWFNDAFGRAGWTLVPTAAPKKVDNLILVPYLLYVHGVPVADATGEQEYIEKNRQQTYGDVIESTRASALRRCAKRLGVGLEMWDKDWLKANVPVLKRAATVGRDDDTVDAETWSADVAEERATAGRPVLDAEPLYVSRAALDRMTEIAERRGRTPAEVSLYLKANFGIKRANELPAKDYARVCRDLEARGDLPMPGDGHP